jgi:hypothetical protein
MNRILMKQKTKGENFLEPPSGTGVNPTNYEIIGRY